MKHTPNKFDSFDIPDRIATSYIGKQTVLLSDTRSYRLLMVIFQDMLQMSGDDACGDEILEEFSIWFIKLGSDMTAKIGLMYLNQEIAPKLGAAASSISSRGTSPHRDSQLKEILMAFTALAMDRKEESVHRYFNLLQAGWHKCDSEHRESLYQGFRAALNVHAEFELRDAESNNAICSWWQH